MRRVAIAVLLVAAAAGCGGGDEPEPGPPKSGSANEPAASAREFAVRFERYTGIRLNRESDSGFGTRFSEPREPNLFARLGVFSLTWVNGPDDVAFLVEGTAPGPGGILWERYRGRWEPSEVFGSQLVLESTDSSRTKEPTPLYARLRRATRAAFLGRPELLRPEERACPEIPASRSPCSVDGVPVWFGEPEEELETPALTAEVTGVRVDDDALVVGYAAASSDRQEVTYLLPQLRLGDELIDSDPAATDGADGPSGGPVEPGEDLQATVGFDLTAAQARRAREGGYLVLPADTPAGEDSAEAEFAQGWLPLKGAPDELPEPPAAPAPAPVPAPPPEPPGPPQIRFERGDGPPQGGSARAVYTAGTFFPIPEDFVRGGVPAGSRAGGCVVPRATPAVKRQLRRAAQRTTRRPVDLPRDDEVLLADCGSGGRWALLRWDVGDNDRVLLDEFARRGGRWVGTPPRVQPGCRIPSDAAAAWQIDVSTCAGGRRAPSPVPGGAPTQPA